MVYRSVVGQKSPGCRLQWRWNQTGCWKLFIHRGNYFQYDFKHADCGRPGKIVVFLATIIKFFPFCHSQQTQTIEWAGRKNIPLVPSAGKHALGGGPSAGNHATDVKRGKTCNRFQARENTQQRGTVTCNQCIPSAGKHATDAKRRKTCSRCQGQENMRPMPSTGKNATLCQARENMQPMPSTEKHVTGAKRGKTSNRCQRRGKM